MGIDQRDRVWELTALSDSHCACVSRSTCLLVRALSKASTSQNRSNKGATVCELTALNSICSFSSSNHIH